jgi:hypothetical protein
LDKTEKATWTNQKTPYGHAMSPASVAHAAMSHANVANATNAVTSPANGMPKQFYDDCFFITDQATSMTSYSDSSRKFKYDMTSMTSHFLS